MDAGMPMPALVSSMPMPSYDVGTVGVGVFYRFPLNTKFDSAMGQRDATMRYRGGGGGEE